MDVASAAGALAELHRNGHAPDGPRLVDYAESPRVGDWTLRSALVRFGQPEPVRSSAVLELVRRTDGALRPHSRLLASTTTATVPHLDADSFTVLGGATVVRTDLPLVADARTADLARVWERWPDERDRVVEAYRAVQPIGDDELRLVPLLAVALELDRLADVLARWAMDIRAPLPIDAVDAVAADAFTRLEAMDVPRETRA